MNYPRIAGNTAMALAPVVMLMWLMDLNFVGWLGAWLAAEAGAWIVGILLAFALGYGLALLWYARLAALPAVKRVPPPIAGALYGVLAGLIFATLVPLLLSALAGNPGMAEGSGTDFDAFPRAFGVRVTPALPDLGFEPPLRSLAGDDWVSRDDYAGRLLPLALAFALYGAVLQLIPARKD